MSDDRLDPIWPPGWDRDEVVAWYFKWREQGRPATVTEIEVHQDALLMGFGPQRRTRLRWPARRKPQLGS